MTIRITTLGRFTVHTDAGEIASLPGQRLRASLLVYLAAEREATREQAMALLWPDRSEAQARHALSQSLHDLRRLLGQDVISARGELLKIGADVALDALLFLQAAESGQHECALGLYAGTFLDGWHLADTRPFEAWVDRQRARLGRTLRASVCALVGERLRRSDGDDALVVARRWVQHEPLEKEASHFLAELLRTCGRPSLAVAALDEHLRLLEHEELEGAADTLMLRQRILGDIAPPPVTARPASRLLVLPFRNLGPAENAFFAEGVTEEINGRLARLSQVAVIARATAAALGEKPALAEIRDRLHVDYVLTGTVRWKGAGPGSGQVRITSELFRADNSDCLWTGANESVFDDVFLVQASVAEEVAQAIGARLAARSEAEALGRPTTNPDAYDLYLQGRHAWSRRTAAGLRKAVSLFQAALDHDPAYAQALAGLADAYAMMPAFAGAEPREWHPRAIETATRALELDPALPQAHAALGLLASIYAWDWSTAERHLRRAIEIAPSYSPAWVWLAYVLSCTGRPGAAADAMDRGYALDPLGVATNFDAGFLGWQLRDAGRAVLLLSRALDLDAAFWPAAFTLGAIHLHLGDAGAARESWLRMGGAGPPCVQILDAGPRPKSMLPVLEQWLQTSARPVYWYCAAIMFALLGAHKRALTWLKLHYRNVRGRRPGDIPTGGANLAYCVTEPIFDPLHAEPRFQLLLRRMNLPA